MKHGDYITWKYLHHFNSRSRAWKTKWGIFIRKVRHSANYTGKQMAVVQFNGNKGETRVPLSEVQVMSNRRKNLILAHQDIRDNF